MPQKLGMGFGVGTGGGPVGPPAPAAFVSAEVQSSGVTVLATFDRAVTGGVTGVAVTVNGSPATVTGGGTAATVLTVTLNDPIPGSQTGGVAITYDGTGDLSAVPFGPAAVVNASTQTGGVTLTASGPWTNNSGYTLLATLHLIGGGDFGGDYNPDLDNPGQGGGGGGYGRWSVLTLPAGATWDVFVSGGGGDSTTFVDGGSGGGTNYDYFASAGLGGTPGTAGANAGPAGDVFDGTAGDIVSNVGDNNGGGSGWWVSRGSQAGDPQGRGGHGGDPAGSPAEVGNSPGGGGGGGEVSHNTGAAGAAGVVYVIW